MSETSVTEVLCFRCIDRILWAHHRITKVDGLENSSNGNGRRP